MINENTNKTLDSIEDLMMEEAAAENVKGGPTCSNNLKQIGLALHSYSSLK